MSDEIAEAIRAGALAAIRKRIAAVGERIVRVVDEKGNEIMTSEGAQAARLKVELEAIAREIETMALDDESDPPPGPGAASPAIEAAA